MTSETIPVPISILRGGTSRGLFFRSGDLPPGRSATEAFLLNVMGSPDVRQINGLGGATPQTSKVAIVDGSSRDDADVDYTFAQVDITRELVDWGGNCGNISSAVGPYAVNAGLVPAVSGVGSAEVRIHNTNTGKIIVARFGTTDGRATVEGDCVIAGVPTSGARIELEFAEPTGSVTGTMLPTGNARDVVTLKDGWSCQVTVVDAANPSVFIAAEDFGLTGLELPVELEAKEGFLDRIEAVRSETAVWLGLVDSADRATAVTPGLPKIGIVSRPRDYVSTSGITLGEGDYGIASRMMSMQFPHRANQITGGIALAVACLVPGSIPAAVVTPRILDEHRSAIVIGHPSGAMEMVVRSTPQVEFAGVAVVRTARHILDGVVHVPGRLFATS